MGLKKSLSKKFSLPKLNFRDSTQKAALVVSLILFGLGVLVSYVFSNSVSNAQTLEFENKQQVQIDFVDKYLSTTINSYEAILVSASAIFKVNSEVTRDDWSQLYKNLRLDSRNPEILGVGYAEYVPGDRIDEHINSVRTSGYPDYDFVPPVSKSEYTITRYLEPLSDTNKNLIGFDMLSEPARSTAIKKAQETQTSALSEPVLAVQDNGRSDGRSPQSLLIYYPVFLGESEEQNKTSNLLGYVYLIFRAEDIFGSNQVLSDKLNAGLRIADVTTDNKLVYEKSNSSSDAKVLTKEISVVSRKWLLGIETKGLSSSERRTPLIYFILGTILSAFVGSYLFMVLSRRSFEVTQRHENDLQVAKNDLLALASHQLRTPATGVRQYLGMLSKGFFGELNQEQKDVANKAYAANNRQLEIIDLLLCVAKADAGQLMIEKAPFELVGVVKKVIEDFKETATTKNIEIVYSGNKQIRFSADQKYLTMVIENIISNAIKYSYADSKVNVTLRKGKRSLSLKVTDNGVGIAGDDQKYLFEKFRRINNPLSRKEGGSGLGLYLARKIARAHGGDIVAHSDGLKGSSFEIVLPIGDDTNSVV